MAAPLRRLAGEPGKVLSQSRDKPESALQIMSGAFSIADGKIPPGVAQSSVVAHCNTAWRTSTMTSLASSLLTVCARYAAINRNRPAEPSVAARIAVLLILGSAGDGAFSGQDIDAAGPGKTLAVMERYNVPVPELSGLARVRPLADETEKLKFYGIGDADYNVARIRISASGDAGIQMENVAHAIGKHARDESQWEAIAVDGKDTVCMLSETRGEITCLDHDLQQDRGRFSLDVSSIGALASAWKARPNSRGEGMILMKKGHVLVLKEKQPSLLIEFGPEGDAPMGYGAETFLREGEAFAGLRTDGEEPVHRADQPAATAQRRLVALKVWAFSERLGKLAKDASELMLGPDGRVYMLSQESSVLIRLEKTLKPDEDKVGTDHDTYWNLPDGMDKAEGLVIDDQMHPWIGVDIKQTGKPNLFQLSPIEAAAP